MYLPMIGPARRKKKKKLMQRVTRDTLNWSVHINNVLAVITDRNPTRAGRSNVINDALYAHIIIVISST